WRACRGALVKTLSWGTPPTPLWRHGPCSPLPWPSTCSAVLDSETISTASAGLVIILASLTGMRQAHVWLQPGVRVTGNAVSRLVVHLAQLYVGTLAPQLLGGREQRLIDPLGNLVVLLFCGRQLDQLSSEQFPLARRVGQLLELLEC